jgi:hypothetical protein
MAKKSEFSEFDEAPARSAYQPPQYVPPPVYRNPNQPINPGVTSVETDRLRNYEVNSYVPNNPNAFVDSKFQRAAAASDGYMRADVASQHVADIHRMGPHDVNYKALASENLSSLNEGIDAIQEVADIAFDANQTNKYQKNKVLNHINECINLFKNIELYFPQIYANSTAAAQMKVAAKPIHVALEKYLVNMEKMFINAQKNRE